MKAQIVDKNGTTLGVECFPSENQQLDNLRLFDFLKQQNVPNVVKEHLRFIEDVCSSMRDDVFNICGYMPNSVQKSPVRPFLLDLKGMSEIPEGKFGFFRGIYDTRTKEVYNPTIFVCETYDSTIELIFQRSPIVVIG